MNFFLKIVVLILLQFLISGCSNPDSSEIPEHLGELENLTVYSADAEPAYSIQLKREQNFGDTDEVFIGWLNAVTVDHTGRVYIADGEELDVKVYEPNGNYLGNIGEDGEGPGEFRNIKSLRTISDQVVVLDANRQLIQWFSADSFDLLDSKLMEPGVDDMEAARVADIFIRNDQSMLLQFSRMISRSERISHYSLLDHTGEITASKILEHRDADIFSDNTDGFAFAMVLPFTRKPLVAVSNTSGMYLAWNDDFFVKKYNYNGEYRRAFYYPFENEELIRSEVLGRYNERYRRGIQNADFPETWPALDEMLIDDKNRLWISTIVEDFDIYEWWVLEETGELITKFEWPRNEPIEVVRNGKMYTRETDEETGLQQVVRYRIEME
ncbi:6-bladed beta-propeller [Rhodohalobacter sp. SW132]|uniref:6-bladed beta-propeller n=1 Tax=Rhodohalobacter sp. SW132 TaxID=2293433 RepID=UPI000E282AA6|nr:6-bladed beta-propeller [Rhodohalobacter sp. SW132]REL37787.1 6-bladed beta-propeller [Rhodohalobacter sp. SW132]